MSLPLITVYSRQGCHLCEELIEELMPLVRGRAAVEVKDVDTDSVLVARYGNRVPVVEIGGNRLCEFRLDPDAVIRALSP